MLGLNKIPVYLLNLQRPMWQIWKSLTAHSVKITYPMYCMYVCIYFLCQSVKKDLRKLEKHYHMRHEKFVYHSQYY